MTLDPLNGDTALSALPQYGGAGGSDQAARYYAGQQFYKLFKRYPTEAELTQFSNQYIGGDPNIANVSGGNSAVAQYYQDQLNDPRNQLKRNEGNADQYSGAVNDIFQQLLNHGATPDEVKHFGGLLASGQVDAYELGQFIQATPEYQNKQDTAFRSQVGGELADLDTKAFGRQKEDVISRFASAGRLGSSALDFALTDLMGKVAEKRQGFLANLSASQYQGNKDNARADYSNVLRGMDDSTNYERDLNKTYRDRGWNVSDYNRQQQDWMAALKNAQKKPNWMDYTAFGLNSINSLTDSIGNLYGASSGSGQIDVSHERV